MAGYRHFLGHIKASFKKSREDYGYRRIHQGFRDMNEPCSKHSIARLMNEHGILPKTRRKFKVTTDSRQNKPIHANHLARQFNAPSVNQRWVSDTTYIPTVESWLYLDAIMDLHSPK